MSTILSVPKDEILWQRVYDEHQKLRYVVTSNRFRDRYFLYEYKNGRLNKVATASTPLRFRRYLGG